MKRTRYVRSEIFPLDPTRTWPSLGSHPRPFRSAIVIRLSRSSAESGRNKGMSQTSAKRVKLSPVVLVVLGKVYTVRKRGLTLGCSVGDVVAHLGLAADELQ